MPANTAETVLSQDNYTATNKPNPFRSDAFIVVSGYATIQLRNKVDGAVRETLLFPFVQQPFQLINKWRGPVVVAANEPGENKVN
jgi:hypothetical protein